MQLIFKTLGVDSIRFNREKDNANRVKDMVNNRGIQTSFRTMGKSGRKKVFFQETEHEVSKAPSFKTTEDISNNSIHFKTCQKWVKAGKANKSTSFKTFDN